MGRAAAVPQPPPSVAATVREGLLEGPWVPQSSLHTAPKYMKAPFTALGAMKGTFMYLGAASHATRDRSPAVLRLPRPW